MMITILGHVCVCRYLARLDCIFPVRNIARQEHCQSLVMFTIFLLAMCVSVCVEIWQVLITLAGKKREVTLTKEKPRDRKLRNANSPSSIQSRGSQISKRTNPPPQTLNVLKEAF